MCVRVDVCVCVCVSVRVHQIYIIWEICETGKGWKQVRLKLLLCIFWCIYSNGMYVMFVCIAFFYYSISVVSQKIDVPSVCVCVHWHWHSLSCFRCQFQFLFTSFYIQHIKQWDRPYSRTLMHTHTHTEHPSPAATHPFHPPTDLYTHPIRIFKMYFICFVTIQTNIGNFRIYGFSGFLYFVHAPCRDAMLVVGAVCDSERVAYYITLSRLYSLCTPLCTHIHLPIAFQSLRMWLFISQIYYFPKGLHQKRVPRVWLTDMEMWHNVSIHKFCAKFISCAFLMKWLLRRTRCDWTLHSRQNGFWLGSVLVHPVHHFIMFVLLEIQFKNKRVQNDFTVYSIDSGSSISTTAAQQPRQQPYNLFSTAGILAHQLSACYIIFFTSSILPMSAGISLENWAVFRIFIFVWWLGEM